MKKDDYKQCSWLQAQFDAGNSMPTIAKQCGVSPQTIAYWRVKLGANYTPKPARRYGVNHTYFATIDSEIKAYALGLWAADGTIVRTGWEARLKLNRRDGAILRMLADDMQFTGPLRTANDGTVTLAVCSTEFIACLAKYGIVPCKTFTVPFTRLPAVWQHHYIRGVLDGDGSVGEQVRLVTGSKPFADQFDQWYSETYGRKLYRREETNKVRFVFNRRDADFVHAVYANATIGIRRKLDAYDTHWGGYHYEGLRPSRGPYRKRKS